MTSRIVSSKPTRRTTPPPTPTPRGLAGIVAAAQKIELTTRDGRKLVRKSEKWQDEAWAFYDVLPAVKSAAGFMGNAMSRVRLFPGVVVDPDEPPVPLADATGETGIDDRLATAADEEMARISNGQEGMPGIMRALGVNMTVAGEAYLVGRGGDDDDELVDEVWGVYSASALEVKGDKVKLREVPGDKAARELPDDTLCYRIWRRHPRWPGLADSNMRAVLDAAEELVIYGRVMRAIAKSGAHAGILKWPTQLDPQSGQRSLPAEHDDAPGPDPAAAGQEGLTPLQQSLLDFIRSSVETDDTLASAMPWLLDGDSQYLEMVEWIDVGRKIDEKALDRIASLYQQLAHGLDLPIEVLVGMADANHWTAWLIEDTTYKAHVEPTVEVVAAGIASAFLRPALLERKFPPDVVRRVVLGKDPSALVTRPNRAQDAKDAHDRLVISDEQLRKDLGFPDTAAPEDEELQRREERSRARRTPAGQPPADDAPAEEGGDPTPGTQPARTLVAAVPPDDGYADAVAALGATLAAIEVRLRERLTIAASDAVSEALRQAGSRLRRAAQGDAELRDRVNGLPPEQVGPELGAEAVRALADPDELLQGAFDGLSERWDTWVGAAQAEMASALAAVAATSPDPDAQAAVADLEAQAAQDRSAGWVVLAGLLLGLTRERLVSHAAEIVEGEHDPTTSVPAGVVREALALAGGGQAGLAPVGAAQQAGPGGLTTGPRVRAVLSRMGTVVLRWRWTTGMPAHPFGPHQRLEGAQFDSWDDPQLTNGGRWPGYSHYFPGDHRGCQCDVIPVIVPVSQSQRQEVA